MRLDCKVMMLGLAMIVLGDAQAQEPPLDGRLLKPVGNVELHGKKVPEIAGRLATIAGVCVAVESLDSISFWGPDPASEGVRIDLDVSPEMTVASALDAAVAADPRYEWQFLGNWLHIMPRDRAPDYPLDRQFIGDLPEGLHVTTLVREIAQEYFPADWRKQYIIRGLPKPRVNDEVPVPAKLTVREAIDIVLWRSGGSLWGTRPVDDESTGFVGTLLEVML